MVLKGIEMVLKEPICPYFDCVAFIFNLTWSNGLERNWDLLQYIVWVPYLSKYGCFAQGNYWTAYGWAYTC